MHQNRASFRMRYGRLLLRETLLALEKMHDCLLEVVTYSQTDSLTFALHRASVLDPAHQAIDSHIRSLDCSQKTFIVLKGHLSTGTPISVYRRETVDEVQRDLETDTEDGNRFTAARQIPLETWYKMVAHAARLKTSATEANDSGQEEAGEDFPFIVQEEEVSTFPSSEGHDSYVVSESG